MCENGLLVTGLREFNYDISGGFEGIAHREFPLSMILTGKKADLS